MSKWNNDLTLDEAKKLFTYDPISGKVLRVKGFGARWPTGGEAGTICALHGYVVIGVGTKPNRRDYRAHRLAWLLHHGRWPEAEIDHINGIRHDNRLVNLREATASQNLANKGAVRNGLKGAYPSADGTRWRSAIGKGAHFIHLGMFDTEEEAHEAWVKAAENRYGEFAHR